MNEGALSFDNALKKLNEGKFQEAGDDFYALLEKNPADLNCTIYLAVAHFNQGEFDQALAALKKAREYHPRNITLTNYLAQAALRQGNFADCLAYVEESLQISPDHAPTYYFKGLAFKQAGRLSEALLALEKARQCLPTAALLKKIDVEIEKLKVDVTVKVPVMAAAPVAPTSPPVIPVAAPASPLPVARKPSVVSSPSAGFTPELDKAYHEGDFARVIELYFQFEKKVNYPDVYLAACSFLNLKSPKCEGLFKVCIQNNTFPLTSHYHLGLFYEENSKLDEAIACYEKCLAISASYFPAAFNLGVVLFQKGDEEKGKQVFQKILSDFSGQGDPFIKERLDRIKSFLHSPVATEVPEISAKG